jgi:hypothetical protein
MVATPGPDRYRPDDRGYWVRPLIIVLFFVLLALASTPTAAESGGGASQARLQGSAGPAGHVGLKAPVATLSTRGASE